MSPASSSSVLLGAKVRPPRSDQPPPSYARTAVCTGPSCAASLFWLTSARPLPIELEARCDRGAGHRAEHLLLVVDKPALVGGHVRLIVRRDEQAVDVRGRDGETEVVADEAAPIRARIARPGARVLRQPAEVLPRLLGVPRRLGDAPVRPDGQGAAAAVVVGLERDINAEV